MLHQTHRIGSIRYLYIAVFLSIFLLISANAFGQPTSLCQEIDRSIVQKMKPIRTFRTTVYEPDVCDFSFYTVGDSKTYKLLYQIDADRHDTIKKARQELKDDRDLFLNNDSLYSKIEVKDLGFWDEKILYRSDFRSLLFLRNRDVYIFVSVEIHPIDAGNDNVYRVRPGLGDPDYYQILIELESKFRRLKYSPQP